uniref:C3H1-type domain-containing protein n=1 Tax=Strongyloides papillosus TaxID=174720 RepID=A0A0N5B974_STREA
MYFPTELEFMSLPSTSHFTNRPQSSLSSGSGSNDSGFFASIHGVSTEVPSLSGFQFDVDSPHGVSPIPYDGEFGNRTLLKCDSPQQMIVNPLQPNNRYFCENRIQINPNVKNVENHHHKIIGRGCLTDKQLPQQGNLLGDYINLDIHHQKPSNEIVDLSNNFMTEPPTQALIEAASKPLNQQQVSQNSKASKADSYKTVMCQAWLENKNCNFGENCRFAHGEGELRPLKQNLRYNTKYKTKLCDRYTNTGICPYGDRCLFVHPNNGNAYFSNEKIAELQNARSSGTAPPTVNQQQQQDRITAFSNKDEASFNNVLVANSDNNNRKLPQKSSQPSMVVNHNNNDISQTTWSSTERNTVDSLNSCFSMVGFDESILFGNDVSSINNNNNNNNYSMDKNSIFQSLQNPSLDGMMFNPTSVIWKNLLYNTTKGSDITDNYLLTPKLSKDLSYAFGSMSLKEESSIDSGAFNNEILERSIAMLNDLED